MVETVLKARINGKSGCKSFEVWCPIPAARSIPVIACSHEVEFCDGGGGMSEERCTYKRTNLVTCMNMYIDIDKCIKMYIYINICI